jgi:hypothetical protein
MTDGDRRRGFRAGLRGDIRMLSRLLCGEGL